MHSVTSLDKTVCFYVALGRRLRLVACRSATANNPVGTNRRIAKASFILQSLAKVQSSLIRRKVCKIILQWVSNYWRGKPAVTRWHTNKTLLVRLQRHPPFFAVAGSLPVRNTGSHDPSRFKSYPAKLNLCVCDRVVQGAGLKPQRYRLDSYRTHHLRRAEPGRALSGPRLVTR